MCMYTERTQVLLTPEQRSRLERMAKHRRVSVGALIREALDAYTARGGQPREEALEALLALRAPVADWKTMKAEILEGAGR